MMTDRRWNPRYVAYATALGRAPEEALSHDAERFPGGKMAGFMAWIQQRWQQWSNLKTGTTRSYHSFVFTEAECEEFDVWLVKGGADCDG